MMVETSLGSVGATASVLMRTVWSSTLVTVLPLTPAAKLDGLLGTLGARWKVNTTSSAVNGEPSCHFTSERSLNSQTVSPTTFQLSARPGISRCFSSVAIRRSKT